MSVASRSKHSMGVRDSTICSFGSEQAQPTNGVTSENVAASLGVPPTIFVAQLLAPEEQAGE
jgi:hypothetical protein